MVCPLKIDSIVFVCRIEREDVMVADSDDEEPLFVGVFVGAPVVVDCGDCGIDLLLAEISENLFEMRHLSQEMVDVGFSAVGLHFHGDGLGGVVVEKVNFHFTADGFVLAFHLFPAFVDVESGFFKKVFKIGIGCLIFGAKI